uniref:Si:dkey-156m2.3 n=1 Tax=Sinocyclocheilus rhinocerous TaxID=307959 RepID=A0A673J5L8_9TELE
MSTSYDSQHISDFRQKSQQFLCVRFVLEHDVLQKILESHKDDMKAKTGRVFEGKKENKIHISKVYTELFITEGDITNVYDEHEVLKIDRALKKPKFEDTPIDCNSIFCLLKQKKEGNIVLTKGIAGIGKTFSVHKLILDWAEGKANQHVDCVFLLPFREINLIKDDKEISLHELLLEFYPDLKEVENTKFYEEYKLAFIFDGLDESRLELDFDCKLVKCVNARSSVDVLFTNLVRGKLLPSALIWVTSRPAAANLIPPEYVGLFTEVRGFTDHQKEEYFRKRIVDEAQASKIISHIRTSRSLYIMCHIPVFCWITASVLQDILLLSSNKGMILKLAKLAFEQLKEENVMFYETDLKACGIDESEESTGLCTEIFKKDSVLHEVKVYYFIHLSVQEFLAALHVFLCYLKLDMDELKFFLENSRPNKKELLYVLLRKAIDKAKESDRGHFDLFLRFLLGISLQSNQKLLIGLLDETLENKNCINKTIQYIKQLQNNDKCPDKSINHFFCILELQDRTLYQQIMKYLKSESGQPKAVSNSNCSALVYVLLMSGEVLDDFDPKMFNKTYNISHRLRELDLSGNDLQDSGLHKLLDEMKNTERKLEVLRKVLMKFSINHSCEIVSSAPQSSNSVLRELDLSNNDLQDSGVKLLSDGLKSPNCQLEILRLSGCMVTEEGCGYLSSALSANPSHLRELDLSYNHPAQSGVQLLKHKLDHPKYKLEKLKYGKCKYTSTHTSTQTPTYTHLCIFNYVVGQLFSTLALKIHLTAEYSSKPNLAGCNLTAQDCEIVSSALQSSNCVLRELDLSNNDLQDSGVKLLSDGVKSPNCQLQILRFVRFDLGYHKCSELCLDKLPPLQSSNCVLRELDLSNNDLQDSGVKLLSDGVKSPNCQLQILRFVRFDLGYHKCSELSRCLHFLPFLILSSPNCKIKSIFMCLFVV